MMVTRQPSMSRFGVLPIEWLPARFSIVPFRFSFPFVMTVTFNGQLVPCGGGDPIPLLKPELSIGRAGSCNIALRYPNVSARHCQLSFRDGYWHLKDLGSSNGIKVNGQRVEERYLHPGDEVTIAKHRFEIDYKSDPNAPPPPEEDIFAKSLMEKAGLERGRPAKRKTTAERPAEDKKPRGNFDSDEDAAFEMLQ